MIFIKKKKTGAYRETKKIVDDGKEVASTFFEEQIQKGLDYLKDEKNREKVVETGIWIAKLAFKKVKEKKGQETKGKQSKGD